MDNKNNKTQEPKTEGYGKVLKINNPEKAKHLLQYIGETGKIIGWIKMSINSPVKYKLMFDNGRTAYFWEDEIEIRKQ